MFLEDVFLKYVQDEQVKGAAPLLPFPPSCCEDAGPSAGAGEERPNPTQSQSTTLEMSHIITYTSTVLHIRVFSKKYDNEQQLFLLHKASQTEPLHSVNENCAYQIF
jgi:hypothetical protein